MPVNASLSATAQRVAARLARAFPWPGPRAVAPGGQTKAPDAQWASEGAIRIPSEAPNKKSSAAGPLIAFESLRRPVWAPRDMAAFAREGFMQNAIVYRCVRMIAECAGSVPLLLYDGDTEIEDHPLLGLIARPNPAQTRADLIETLVGHLLVTGNAYLEAVSLGADARPSGQARGHAASEAPRIRELHTLRPDRMKVIPGPDGWPEAYEYTVGGRSVRLANDTTSGRSPVLHLKQFHPDNDHYGMSPLEAAASAIDLHNTSAAWNKALLDNAARPSGALVYTSRDGHLSGEQYERLKAELESGFQGATNAGRPLLLEGGLDWKSMSLSPKDMDFIEARHVAAREIALALGVPPMLLGIPGDNTYANMAEAQRILWRQTVLPTRHPHRHRALVLAFAGLRRCPSTETGSRSARGPRARTRSPVVRTRKDILPHAQRKARGHRLRAVAGCNPVTARRRHRTPRLPQVQPIATPRRHRPLDRRRW